MLTIIVACMNVLCGKDVWHPFKFDTRVTGFMSASDKCSAGGTHTMVGLYDEITQCTRILLVYVFICIITTFVLCL